jgi:hypothetical protein
MRKIDRKASITFHDASMTVSDEGPVSNDWDTRQQLEKAFKKDVFKRVVQTLNRLGWHVGPQHYIFTDDNNRFCTKGALKGDLQLSGRNIRFSMFQSENCPSRPDYEGRHESNKETLMTYTQRLEMERTRRRIRDYLTSVFSDITFKESRYDVYVNPLKYPALERLRTLYQESGHYRGTDWEAYKINHHGLDYNRKSADGVLIEHGQRVWFPNDKGRILEGTAYYGNGMWWIVSGRYGLTRVGSGSIFVSPPENLRVKKNANLRRKRLEQELKAAVDRMDFKRAQVLKDVIYPPGPIYAIWHKHHKLFFSISYAGYCHNLVEAGHYTRAELKPYLGEKLENETFKAVLVSGSDDWKEQALEAGEDSQAPQPSPAG